MNVKNPVTATITIGDQPTDQDLLDCKYEGYVGVVNLRHDGEPEQPMGTGAEGTAPRGWPRVPALWRGRTAPGRPGRAGSL